MLKASPGWNTPSLVPQLDQTVGTSCQNKGFSRLLDDRNIVDPVIVSLDLKYLLDIGRRNDVVGLSMREIMSIGAILGSPKVVVVFNSVRIFIANHVNSDWFQLLLFYKLRKVNNTNISKLISKDQLTFQRLFGSWLGIVG